MMEKNKIGLGSFLNELLSKLQLEIKDATLLQSLDNTVLNRTDGLKLFYPKDAKAEYDIPKVNAQEILQKVNLKEELFENFWNMYNKKTGGKDAKAKFLKLTDKEIDQIFKTLPHYVKSTPDVKFRKHPLTYLNQRTWEDEEYLPRKVEAKVNPFRF